MKVNTTLKKGDTVMVIAGGNKNKRANKGKIGKILKFVGDERVIVEGINLVTKHKKARQQNETSSKIQTEGSIHISNVMLYVEKLKKPVRVKSGFLEDGSKVRGYTDPVTKAFTQI